MYGLLAAAVLAAGQPTHTARHCTVDTAAILKLSPYEFDQTNKGFRSLPSGCDLATADLIAAYRRANWGKLTNNDVAISYWHEGQSRAFAGQTQLAIPLLLAGVNPGATGLGAGTDRLTKSIGTVNAEYALATVA